MKKQLFTVAVATGMLLASAVGSFAGTLDAGTELESESTNSPQPITKDFKDLNGYGWAKTNITSLVGIGAIAGYPDGTFKPGNSITAAEFTKITVGLVASEEDVNATEVTENPQHWAAHHMAYAYEHQMIPEGMFNAEEWDKAVSRQKMAVIMENTAELVLNENVVTDSTKLSVVQARFTDYASICDNCKDKVLQAYCRGLINGYADGTFGPTKNSNRAEASTMLIRLLDATNRLEVSYEAKPVDPLESHVTTTYPAGNRGDFYTKYIGAKGVIPGDATIKSYDSAKALGLSVVGTDEGKTLIKMPRLDNLVAMDKNGKELAFGDIIVTAVKGYSVLDCNLSDIAYFGFHTASKNYSVSVNDLK